MDQLSQIRRQHTNFSKISAAVIYALCVSIALNFFWEPGHIYASGVTGFAQIIQSLSHNILPTNIMYFALNIPLVIMGWLKIGHKFTLYTVLAVAFSSIMMKVMHQLVHSLIQLSVHYLGEWSTVLELDLL